MDFDELLAKCGNHSRYQYLLLAAYCYLLFVNSMQFFSQNIISFVPQHWCYHEQLENRSFTEIEAIYAQFKSPSCTRLEEIEGNNVTVSSEVCERWIYKYDYGYRSMNTELNWVCDSAYKARVGQSLFFVGSVFGTLIFGGLGDRVGRVKAMVFANLCGFVGEFSTIFANSLTGFSISRFVSGMAAESNTYIMYILVVEFVSPSLRNRALSTVYTSSYCAGMIASAWLAVWVGYWRSFLLCSSLPLLVITSFFFLVQESAQWLVTRNDVDGAVKRLKRVAKINRRIVGEEDFEAFRKYCEIAHETESPKTQQKETQLIDMLKTPRMRKTAFKLLLLFVIICSCYTTIAPNVEGLGISPFVMFSLNALTVLPSGLLQAELQSRFGRKPTVCFSMFISALLSLITSLVLSQYGATNILLLIALMMCVRFGISVCTGAGFQFTTELIPTCVRSRGLAAVHVAGYIVSFLSPYILLLGDYFKPLPSIVLCLLFLTGGYVCLLLPETRNKKLPITLADGEQFGRGERMFDFLRRDKNTEETVNTTEAGEKLMRAE
ncbi:organic cation transporter protein-like [Scaptodrosophila lebanonensis]|uniref:Organic cation transporter protein-like n=1 Tax=Drosophila lebanonensis TaxID=7225 RepID=A0A6J2T885_DROLE|nr:organic cation transporter protein-like [Scaptodrosophila lebanonensis]